MTRLTAGNELRIKITALSVLVSVFVFIPLLSYASPAMLPAISAILPSEEKPGGKTAGLKAEIDQLLAAFPAENARVQESLAGKLLSFGPEAVEEVCRRLSPAGVSNDSRARFAVNAMAVSLGRPGRERQRIMYIEKILALAQSSPHEEIRNFLISHVQLAGKAEAVKPLARLLTDERTAGPAARALQSIGGPQAGKLLLKSLGKVRGLALEAVIQAIGQLRTPKAAKKLRRYTSSDDPGVRQAALHALALTGDPAVAELLSESKVAASYEERHRAAFLYITYARELAGKGHRREALDAADSIYEFYRRPGESHIASDALELIVTLVDERTAVSTILKALDEEDQSLRAAALELGFRINRDLIVPALIEKAPTVTPATRAQIIDRLGRRRDARALPLIRMSLSDRSADVRLAAIEAINGEWTRDLLHPLIELVTGSEEETQLAAARKALLCFDGKDIMPLVIAAMPSATGPAKAVLLEILGEKAAEAHADLVFAETGSGEDGVRSAALKALAGVARPQDLPRLIRLLTEMDNSREIKNLEDAVAAAATREADTAVSRLINLIKDSPDKEQEAVIRILARFGGKTALDFVSARLSDENPRLRTAALVALSRWPEIEAASRLLGTIKQTDSRHDLLIALEGYVRLVNDSKEPAWKKYQLFKDCLDSVREEADKTVILRGLSAFRDPWTFKLLSAYLGHPVLGPAASEAILEIASEQAPAELWLSRQEAVAILKKIEDLAEDPADMARVRSVIDRRLKQGGFVQLFNGQNLEGWKGLVADPPRRARMSQADLSAAQAEADDRMRSHWKIENGALVFDGRGESLCTASDYADFEFLVDWKIEKGGDSGIYLRGSPQVQIWDPEANPEGSGGLYNNQKGPSKPLARADRPAGEWNNFRIIMIGDLVTVYLNDKLVVDNVALENYWEREKPIYPAGQIELQAHGNRLCFKDIWIREIQKDSPPPELDEFEAADGFLSLFNDCNLEGWIGAEAGYAVENGKIIVVPDGATGNLYTEKEYSDFILRFDFKLYPASNNGIGIRAPVEGDAAYSGLEIQILEDGSPVYRDLKPYQYHGSVYGVFPARRGVLKPPGEWNSEEINVEGRLIKVIVNGVTVVDCNLDEASRGGTIDGREHPGLGRDSGRIGLLDHGSRVEFRNIRLKALK